MCSTNGCATVMDRVESGGFRCPICGFRLRYTPRSLRAPEPATPAQPVRRRRPAA